MKTQTSRTKQKGFTLIELVVAFAILAGAFIAIGGFMIAGVKSFNKTNAEQKVQSEAQEALNQIENLVIDASLGVNYNLRTASGVNQWTKNDGGANAIDDSGAAIDALSAEQYKILYIFNFNKDDNSLPIEVLLLAFDPTNQKIYYTEKNLATPTETTSPSTIADLVADGEIPTWDLLADRVTAFSADLTEYEVNNLVTLSMSFERSERSYSTTGKVTLRNTIAINELDINKIFQRVSGSITVEGVSITLTGASSIVRDGDGLQLLTKTSATRGYPSQQVFAWQIYALDNIGSTTETLIYDTTDDNKVENAYVYVDPATKVLTATKAADSTAAVNGVAINTLKYIRIFVYATVEAYNDKANGVVNPAYASLDVGIDYIDEFFIQPDKDNSTITSTAIQTFPLSSYKTELSGVPEIYVNNGDIIQMVSYVNSDTIKNTSKAVVWEIVNASENVIVSPTLNSTGTFTVDAASSKGTFYIKGYPKTATGMTAYYKVNINSKYAGQELSIKAEKATIYRGESTVLTLSMNGTPINAADYDKYTFSICSINGAIPSDAMLRSVSLDYENGLKLVIGKDLNFDNTYNIEVKAVSRVDSAMTAVDVVKVPAVSLSLNPVTYFLGNKWADVAYWEEGKAGGLHATVVGIASDKYTLDWSIESNVYPGFVTAIPLTGTYVSWDQTNHPDTVAIHIGEKETSKLTYLRVKVSLHDHASKSAVSKVVTGSASLSISQANDNGMPRKVTAISRADGAVAYYKAAMNPSNLEGYDAADIVWAIDSVKLGTQELAANGLCPGVTVTNEYVTGSNGTKQWLGVLRLDKSLLPVASEDIKVTVSAKWGGLPANGVLVDTIEGITFEAKVEGRSEVSNINRGQSLALTAEGGFVGTATWEVVSVKAGGVDVTSTQKSIAEAGLHDTGNTSGYTVPYDLYSKNDNKVEVTLRASVPNSVMAGEVKIEVNTVGVQLAPYGTSAYDPSTQSFAYQASGIGLADGTVTSYSWGLSDSTDDLPTLDGADYAGAVFASFNSADGKQNYYAKVSLADRKQNSYGLFVCMSVIDGEKTIQYGDAAIGNPTIKSVALKMGVISEAEAKTKTYSGGDTLYLNQTEKVTSSKYTIGTNAVSSLVNGNLYALADDYFWIFGYYYNFLTVSGSGNSWSLGITEDSADNSKFVWKYADDTLLNMATYNEGYSRYLNISKSSAGLNSTESKFIKSISNTNIYLYCEKGNKNYYLTKTGGSSLTTSTNRNYWYFLPVTETAGSVTYTYNQKMVVQKESISGTASENDPIYLKVSVYAVSGTQYSSTASKTIYLAYEPIEGKWYNLSNNKAVIDDSTPVNAVFGFADTRLGAKDLCSRLLTQVNTAGNSKVFIPAYEASNVYSPSVN